MGHGFRYKRSLLVSPSTENPRKYKRNTELKTRLFAVQKLEEARVDVVINPVQFFFQIDRFI